MNSTWSVMGTSGRLVDGSSFPHWKTLCNIHSTVLILLTFIMFLKTNKNRETYGRRKWQFTLSKNVVVNMAASFRTISLGFVQRFGWSRAKRAAKRDNARSRAQIYWTRRFLFWKVGGARGEDFEHQWRNIPPSLILGKKRRNDRRKKSQQCKKNKIAQGLDPPLNYPASQSFYDLVWHKQKQYNKGNFG